MKKRHKLLVLTAVLMALASTSTSSGAEYREEIPMNQQHIEQFVPLAVLSLRLHPRDFERCSAFGREIEVISEKELPAMGPLLYRAPSIEGTVRRFRHVQALTRRQLSCERRERWRATQRAALTECVRQVSETYGEERLITAPWPVKAVICAASYIDEAQYVWGGGHGTFKSYGYDCSGAVGYALHGGHFLESPVDSTGLSIWGEPGPGQWITVYANSKHVWMTIGGLVFDTFGGDGPRWYSSMVHSPGSYVVRHPDGY